MKYKSILLAIVVVFAGFGLPYRALATASSGVVISELSMGSVTSATEEFVELYNNSTSTVSMSGWSLYYKSATGKTYSKRATFTASASVSSHSFFLVSTNTGADLTLISGMAQTAGVIELRDNTGAIVDKVGWGSADTSTGKPAVAPEAGQSLYRQYEDGTATMVNTSDNFSDFYIAAVMTPKALPAVEAEQVDENITYPALVVNELYPNPTDDQSESADEFIEIYNPNSVDVDINGWLLRDSAGNTFIIKNHTILAGGYIVLMSSETHLSLNNTGDVISLINPAGDTVDQSADYGESKEGLSWGLVNGTWDWNTMPTPAVYNSTVYVSPVVTKPVASKSTAKTTTAKKKAAVKKAAATKPKASKLKATKAAASNSDASGENQAGLQSNFANLWPWLLIILGTGTIGYGIYEYKPEIIAFYYQLKNKLGAGR